MIQYSVSDLLIISIVGFIVVFAVLVSLAFLTTIIGKVIPSAEAKRAGQAAEARQTPAGAPAEDETAEIVAVIHSVISEQSGIAADELEILSIREVEDR